MNLNVARSLFGALGTASYSDVCVGVLVVGGETTRTDMAHRYTNTVECFRSDGWEILTDYEYNLNDYGHFDFDMVAVTNKQSDQSLVEDIYILGGIRVGSQEQRTETNEVNVLYHGTKTWTQVGTLLQARAAHRSWVSYGLQEGTPEENWGDYDKPMIFSVAGTGAGDLHLEYFDVTTMNSYSTYGNKGAYKGRFGIDIMVFGHGEFDLNLLPTYEDHCDLED